MARNDIGSIIAIVTPDGVVDSATASEEIDSGRARYFAGPDSYVRVPVKVFCDAGGPYLYANWDGTRRNQLHDLAVGGRRAIRAAGRSVRSAPADMRSETRMRAAAGTGAAGGTRPVGPVSTLMRVLGLG